jgi:hypothetical protein
LEGLRTPFWTPRDSDAVRADLRRQGPSPAFLAGNSPMTAGAGFLISFRMPARGSVMLHRPGLRWTADHSQSVNLGDDDPRVYHLGEDGLCLHRVLSGADRPLPPRRWCERDPADQAAAWRNFSSRERSRAQSRSYHGMMLRHLGRRGEFSSAAAFSTVTTTPLHTAVHSSVREREVVNEQKRSRAPGLPRTL